MIRTSSAKTRSAATRSPGSQGKRRFKARHRPAWDVCMCISFYSNVDYSNFCLEIVMMHLLKLFRAARIIDQLIN